MIYFLLPNTSIYTDFLRMFEESLRAKVLTFFFAQSFHWFDQAPVKFEVKRIIKPGVHTAVTWKVTEEKLPFQKSNEDILNTNIQEFTRVKCTNASEKDVEEFFSPMPVHIEPGLHIQEFRT